MYIQTVSTRPFAGQRPGTAGLRKKTREFLQPHFLENYLEALFTVAGPFRGRALVAGGDGRYHNAEALQTVARMAAAHGVSRLIVGRDGLLSTPAASHLVRCRHAAGGLLLTASHNPGGPEGDFGIKFNTASGGQAPEALTEAIYAATRGLSEYRIAALDPVDLGRTGESEHGGTVVEVVDPVADYARLMEGLFDFDRIRAALSGGLRLRFDAMHGVTGPYATEILERRLGAEAGSVARATPLPDFGGGHPDPNPVDAAGLVEQMAAPGAPELGAASDGDGDRNMILGPGIMVSPGDSLAILAARAREVPGYARGLAGVARSMPTSRAVDRVAAHLGIPCHETPTGWRFFCNLLEAGRIDLCGEESFGTGSSHVREKDGLWAVLFWLNLLATSGHGVSDLVRAHWARYGRNVFCREDYLIPDVDRGHEVMARLEARLARLPGRVGDGLTIERAERFDYTDPVDGSVSTHQGIRVFAAGGDRIVYRLSGTGTEGATLRVYLERYLPPGALDTGPATTLTMSLGALAGRLAKIVDITGLRRPTARI